MRNLYKLSRLLKFLFAVVFTTSVSSAMAQYTWTGAAGGVYNVAANWSPVRTTPATTDILIFDGNTTLNPTVTGVITQTVGQIRLVNNVNVILQSSVAATLTISGGANADLDIPAGSTLNLNSASGINFNFTGAQTASIAGTFTASSSGVGSLNFTNCTAIVSGTMNNANSSFTFTSTTANLSFAAGASFNHSGTATGATLPLATWDPASNLNITGMTSVTTVFTNNAQAFGNLTWNCPSQTVTPNAFFAGNTAIIAGNLNVLSTGSGRFRLLGAGNLTVGASINVSGGILEFMNATAVLTVTGSVIVNGSGTVYFANGAGTNNIGGNVTVSGTGAVGFGNGATTNITTINGNLSLGASVASALAITSGTPAVNVLGNFSLTAGTFSLATGTGAGSLKVAGTFTQSAGTTLTNTGALSTIEFNGTVSQAVSANGTISGANSFRLNNPAGIVLTGTLTINSTASYTVSNGATTGGGTLSYNVTSTTLIYNNTAAAQTASAQEFPASNGPASLIINNTAISPANQVTVPFNRTLGAAGVLTLTAGILNNTGFTLTIPNTIVAAVVGGSATSYIKGAVTRSLPASLVSGSTYTFPVGKSAYNPLDLVNPTTGSGGTVTIKAEVFDASTGGTAGTLMESISTSRYWASTITAGAANLTGTLLRLNDTRNTLDGIAASATLSGVYNHIGGNSSTLTPTSITTMAPAITSFPGFFVMGNLAAATLTNLLITPAGNQCVNVARTVTITVTPGAGTITTVTLNYQVNGGTVQTVAMSNTGGNNWSGIIPAVTPATATVTWSVTATDVNSLTKTATGTPYADQPLTGVTVSANANPATVCSGSPSVLTALVSKPATAQVGSGTSTGGSGTAAFTAGRNFYGTYWGNARQQWLIKASELTALGFTAGNISSLAISVGATGTPATLTGFTIKLANTSASTITTAFLAPAFTTVWGPQNYTPVVGTNTHTFTTLFLWDGTSNVVLDVCSSNQVTGSANATNNYTVPGFACGVNYGADGAAGAGACTTTTVSNGSLAARPNVILTANLAPPISSYTWNSGASTVGTGNPLTVNPVSSTSYTVKATDAQGCTITSPPVTINTTALPSAPEAHNSSQCGTRVPEAFVTSTFSTGTVAGYRWYDAQTGGSLLQTGGASYSGSISTSTHLWVSETNGTCESVRTDVLVSVINPDEISATADNLTPCFNSPIQLSVADVQLTPVNTYSFSWSSPDGAASGISGTITGNSISVTPTAVGIYRYVATATDGDCITTDTVSVTVKALPVLNMPTSTPAGICPGNSATLTATSFVTGTVIVGTGSLQNAASSTTATGYPAPFGNYYQGALNQMLITASELTAAGLKPGNITSIAFDVATPKTTALTGFNIGIKTSSLTALSALETGFTTVYSVASYTPSAMGGYAANTINFSIPFNWNGTSNIIIQTCFANTSFSTNAVFNQSTTAYVSTLVYRADLTTVCSSPGSVTFSYSQRPNMKLAGQVTSPTPLTYTWQPGSLSGSSVNVSPAVTTIYTVTATDPLTTCSSSAQVNLTVYDLPPAVSVNGSEQCGLLVPTASVSSNSMVSNPVFKWYDSPVGGTLLQTGTSPTYLTAINTTTSFYVAEVNAQSCEGPRTEVVVNVIVPDPVTVSASPEVICIGGSFDLTATQQDFNNTYEFVWSAAPANNGLPGSPTGTTVNNVTPTVARTYTYTVTATDVDKGCQTTAQVNVTAGAYPTISTVNATPNTTCSGGAVTLSGSTNIITPGTITIGTGTTLTGAAAQPTAFCNRWAQYWSQTVYTAAELTAAGLTAGNISAIAYNISTLGDASTNPNFTVKIATTSGSTVAGFVTTGLTNVYGPAVYTHAVGLNIINFDVPYNWDGVSNLLIDIRHDGADAANNARTYYTATAGNTTVTATTSTSSSTQVLASSNPTAVLSTSRLNINLYGQTVIQGAGPYNWTWNPGPLTGSTVTAHPATSTSYIATATDPVTGCSTNSLAVTVTVTSVTATASATPNTPVCAGTSVVLNTTPAGGGPFSYSWSDGTNIIGNTQSITVSPSVSTNFTVTVTDGCGGTTTASVNVTVKALPTAFIAEAGPINICSPATQILTANTNGTSPTYQWQNGGVNIAGATGSTYTVTISGSYTVIVTFSGCSSAASAPVNVTINPKPSTVVITPASTTICNGAIVTLIASVSTVSALSGSGTSTTVGNTTASTLGPNPLQIYYGGVKQQMVYRASELLSLGLGAGSTISAIKINLATADATLPLQSLRVKMKNSTTASLSTTWEAGMTIVRTAANYTPVVGLNTIPLTTNFVWDGVSNFILEVTYSNNNTGTTSAPYNTAKYSATTFPSTIFYVEDAATANSLSNYTGAVTYAYNSRTDLTFDFSNPGTIKWAPLTGLYTNAGATTAYTGTVLSTVYAKPASTTTYTATATSTSGCTNSSSSVITVNQRPTGVLSGGGVYCSGQSTTTLLSIAVTGTGPWTGTLSGGISFSGNSSPVSVSVNPVATTTYTIATLNGSLCSAIAADLSGSATVTVNPQPATPIITAGGPVTFCSGGSVVLTSSSATGNQWSLNGTAITGQTNQTLSVTASGNYSVTVTAGSCSGTSTPTTITVNPQPATPTITAGGSVTFCSGGSVVLTSSSATGNQWSLNGTAITGQTNQTLTVTASGNYTVTVTAGSCSATSTPTTITVNPQPATPTITAGGPTTFCSGGSVVLTSSSATGNQWSLNGTAITGQTNQTLTVTASGDYTVTVTAGSCSATSTPTTITVNPQPATPTITAGGPTTFCSGGSVVLTSSSATGNQWSLNGTAISGETNQTLTVTASGDYTVTVSNGSCSATSTPTTITVNPQPATPTITAGGPPTFCSGGSVVLTSSSATGNQWSLNGTAISGETNQTLTVTASGDYTVTVSNGSCSATSTPTTITVNPQPATPTITAGGPTTFCSGGSVVLTSSSATGNQWSLNGTAISGETNQTLTVTASGDYTVTVSNGSCSATSTPTTITVNPQPATPTITAGGPTTFCSGGSVVLTSSSATGNQWSLNGTAISGETNQTLTVTASGDYTVTVSNGSCSATSTPTTITVNPQPATPTITAGGPPTFCSGGSVVLTSSSATGNQWSLNGTAISGETNQTLTVTASGDYTVTVSNGSCSATSTPTTITVNLQPATPTITAGGPATFCSGGSVVLTSSSATGNQWNLNGTAIAGQTNQTLTVTASGDYTVTVSNGFGCSATSLVTTVTVNPTPATPTITAGGPTTFCQGGSVVLTSSSATGNQWNLNGTAIAGQTNQTLTVTASGNYTVTVTAGSCSATSAATSVTVNPLAANATANVTQPTCSVGTGTITVTSPLGAGITYSLDGGAYQGSVTFSAVAPGMHTLTAKTSSGCFSPASTSVTVNPQPFTPSAPMLSGIVSVCPYLGTGQQLTYTAAAPGATGFNWLLPPNVNLVSGQGTSSIVVTLGTGLSGQANKQLRVTATSTCGTSPLAILYLLTEAPHTPDPITGPVNLCPLIGTGTVATYIIPSALSATRYTWIVPANTTVTHPNIVNPADSIYDTVINVVYNAGFQTGQPVSISAIARNGCGLSGTRTIQLSAQPAGVPGLINGPTNVCANILPGGTAATYSVAAMSGVTSYSWTTPSGTTVTHPNGIGTANDYTITVLYPAGFTSGTITVTATNGCGMGSPRSLNITKLNPATPGNIDVIQTHFCGEPGGRVFTYTISAMPANATSILWTIPTTGAMLVSGQGSTSITVSYTDGAVNSSVTATAQNNCANSSTRSVLVKLPACPVGFAGGGKVQSKLPAAVAQSSPMEVRIFPNPTVSDFKLEVLSRSAEQIDVRVIDIQGKLYKSFRVAANQVIALGAELKSGSYLVEVRQGTELKTTKVVKF